MNYYNQCKINLDIERKENRVKVIKRFFYLGLFLLLVSPFLLLFHNYESTYPEWTNYTFPTYYPFAGSFLLGCMTVFFTRKEIKRLRVEIDFLNYEKSNQPD